MKYSEFKYLGSRPALVKRDIGNRKITKEVYINPNLSVKLVNRYTLTCIDELELMKYNKKKSEFDQQAEKLKSWYENNYNLDLIEFKDGFPLLWELSNLGDVKAREVYNSLIYQKDKLDLLINVRVYKSFTDIYHIFLKYLEDGRFRNEWVDMIKLDDLCMLYYKHYQINSFDNDFYMMVWSIVKKNLNIPYSIPDENLIKDIFSLFKIDFWNYDNSRFDYGRLYNRKFFEEILNPLFQRIFESKSSLIDDFNKEMEKRIDPEKLSKMALIDCLIRYFGRENLLRASQNTNLLHYIKRVIKNIKMLHQDDCWGLYSSSADFFDYTFYLYLKDFLCSAQEHSREKSDIEELILFIEEMMLEIRERDETTCNQMVAGARF